MKRFSSIVFLGPIALGLSAGIVHATTIFDPTVVTIRSDAFLGSIAAAADSSQVQWNSKFVGGVWQAVRSDGSIFTPPPGVVLTGSVFRTSELGTYGLYEADCSGLPCSVVFSGSNGYTLITHAEGVTVTQISENGGFVGNVEGSADGSYGNLAAANGPFSILAGCAGYFSSISSGISTSTGPVAVGLATADGVTGQAAVFTATDAKWLNALGDSGAVGLSLNTLLATGYDSTYLTSWNVVTGASTYYVDKNGNRQNGIGHSIVSTGAIGGQDGNGYGIIYSPFFGYTQSTCSFIVATGGTVPSQYLGGNGNCLMGFTLIAENSLGDFSVAALGSGIEIQVDSRYLQASELTSQTPEPSNGALAFTALLGLTIWIRHRGRGARILRSEPLPADREPA